MASTPSNRLKLTPSNSPYKSRFPRSPSRARTFHDASASLPASSRLSLTRVVGSTCCSPTGFDTVHSCFAYIAGGAVVVVDVHGNHYRQRFYRARPTAVPVYSVSPVAHAPSTPSGTPKANDSRNRAAPSHHRESGFGLSDWADSPTSGKTWTQRERIKSATCLSLSRDGRFLAVGETGYAPRVLIFSLDDASSDIPLVCISEHSFGVTAVAWSADSRYLASLGTANDGFLYLWKIDPRTGSARLFQQNRCTSYVRGMIWLGSTTLITFGMRHIKVWRVEEGALVGSASPGKPGRHTLDGGFSSPMSQQQHQQQQNQAQHKTLPGRNILLGSLLDATFSCAAMLAVGRAIICSEAGDVCLLESATKQTKLVRLRNAGFPVTCVSVREGKVYVGGKSGQSIAADLVDLLAESECRPDGSGSGSVGTRSSTASPTTQSSSSRLSSVKSTWTHDGLVAMGFLTDHVVTVDTKRSIDIFLGIEHVPGTDPLSDVTRIPIPGHGEPILGVQALAIPNAADAAFFTWSASGTVLLWGLEGEIKASFTVPVEQTAGEHEMDMANQLSVVRATKGAKLFVTADRRGILRVMDFATREFVLETKAHASECQSVSIFEDERRLLLASSGRDRTAQLFSRRQDGTVAHFQTLEFSAKVVQVLFTADERVITCSFDRTMQVHELVAKEGEPDVLAAIPVRVITLKASPSSMALAAGARSVYVSLLDRTVCQYDLATGKLLSSFKCIDEGGAETALLDSLIYGKQAEAAAAGTLTPEWASSNGSSSLPSEAAFLLGLSNTDKSVRIYDAQTGSFLDREWGHTEAINGVALIDDKEDEGGCRKVVSVGSDGTIMVWALDLRDPVRPGTSGSRDPSPSKDGGSGLLSTAVRPPLRRVLSKAELAEFQRTGSGGGGGGGSSINGSVSGNGGSSGKRSPSRSLSRKTSRYNLSSNGSTRPPMPGSNTTNDTITEDAKTRRASAGSGPGSPPMAISPKAKVRRRPSLPAMSSGGGNGNGSVNGSVNGNVNGNGRSSSSLARKKPSMSNLRGAQGQGSLSSATEQTCRQLRAYRKRLATATATAATVGCEMEDGGLGELDQELRLTLAALGDRTMRSRAAAVLQMSEQLDGLLDEKVERLVVLLDEKWRVQQETKEREREKEKGQRQRQHPKQRQALERTSKNKRTLSARRRGQLRHGSGSGSGSASAASTASRASEDQTTGDDDHSSNSNSTDDNTVPSSGSEQKLGG